MLEYDGIRWRLIQTPRRTTVRSLTQDSQGRIYVGAVGEIGYLAPDATGQMAFVDLTSRLDPGQRGFSDVWTAAATPLGLFFQSREYLFLLSPDRVLAVKASSTFHLAFALKNRIFVRQRGIGLMELSGDRLALVPGGERFANESIFMMVEAGKDSPGTFLIGSRNLGLWQFDGIRMKAFPSEADAFLKANSLYHGTRLEDGTLALATIRGGVAFLDAKGGMVGTLNRASGLLGDNIKHLYPDHQGSLWMALDDGIAKVEWPSPFSIFGVRSGLKGNAWAIHRHQGHLYVATGQGTYFLEADPTEGGQARFRQVEGVSAQSIAFLSVEKELLLTCGQGVFLIDGARSRPIFPSSSNAISLLRSKADPARVFVGMQGGLISIYRTSRGWVKEAAIPGISDDIYSMAEAETGCLWLGTQAQGALRVRFPQGWTGGTTGGIPQVEHFGEEQGLPRANQACVGQVGPDILIGTHDGFYRCDESAKRLIPDPRFSRLFPEGNRWIRTFRQDPQGRIWLDTKDEIRGIHESGVIEPQPEGAYRWEAAPFRRFAELSIESIFPEPSGTVWFGGPEGLLRFDPGISRKIEPMFPVLVRRVFQKGDAPPMAPTSPGEAPAYKFAENALRFEFSLPSYDQESANRFQVLLEGHDQTWSSWSSEAQKEYTNLPEGGYRFRVRGRNIYGHLSPEGTFAFRILPPWYRTLWAYALFLLIGSAGVFLALRLRTRILEERNTELQRRIDRDTLELRERERLLAFQAGELAQMNGHLQTLNAQLQDANEEKNQFLGVVVHDLRNPLNGILLGADLIEEADSLSEAKTKARIITRRCTEMNLLIGRFLDIAALDSGAIRPEPETLSLNSFVMENVELHRPRAREKGIEIQTELSPGPGMVLADPRFLRAALDNLLSNAVKFSSRGTLVCVEVAETDTQIQFSVSDEGPGLSEEDQRRLFGRFMKLSARPTGGEKSVGLGLSIVKKMLDAMGAQITVESQIGRGTRFRVALPLPGQGPDA